MVVPLIVKTWEAGLEWIPGAYAAVKALPVVGLVLLLKVYFGGAKNKSERVMHGKVVMVTVGSNF